MATAKLQKSLTHNNNNNHNPLVSYRCSPPELKICSHAMPSRSNTTTRTQMPTDGMHL